MRTAIKIIKGVCCLLPFAMTAVTDVAAKAATQIAAGYFHTCMLESQSNIVSCWGSNTFGQLGTLGIPRSSIPLPISGSLGNVTAISAGANQSCAVSSDGAIRCWGQNSYGQLGNGSLANSFAPVRVSGLSAPAVTVALGPSHACALLRNGSVDCWGDNTYGQLGSVVNGSSQSATAVSVSGLGNSAIAVAVGDYHTCAVLADGSARCWGTNRYGQLGNGSASDSAAPNSVNNLGGAVKQLVAGDFFTCALLSTGLVKCWGSNFQGAIGNGIPAGGGSFSSTPVLVEGLSNSVELVRGPDRTCSIDATRRTTYCWGNNLFGQLGNTPGATYSAGPIALIDLSAVVEQLALGQTHTCAMLDSGLVKCWGYNNYGNLGNGTAISQSAVPVIVLGTNVSAMVEFVNSSLDYYFLTSRRAEVTLLDAIPSWQRTGATFNVLNTQDAGALGLSRYYFDRVAMNGTRGSHFYTVEQAEKDALRALNPNNISAQALPFNEGVDSFVFPTTTQLSGTVCAAGQMAVYRIFRGPTNFPDSANHRFTTDYETYTRFVALGWDGEGTKFCVPK